MRQPVSRPSQNLIDEIKNRNVVPLIGAGFSKSALSGNTSAMPDYKELLQRLLKIADVKDKTKRIVQDWLDSTDPRDLEKAARELREEMGDYRFYIAIRNILEPIDKNIQESMSHKLLRMLNFKRILTTNYDRLLERFVAPDYEMFTTKDLVAFRIFLTGPEREFILKLHGDITRPDTIPFGLTDLYKHYGYEHDGRTPLANISPEAEKLREFLKTTFENNTVLFLGSSLSESEGYARLLINLVREWGGSLAKRHYALVPYSESTKELREYLSREMNIEYITYHPDDVHSQVWEFLAFLNQGVYDDKPIPGRKWGQSYLPERRVEYLQKQLSREKNASRVCFLTPTLTNAVTTHDELITSSRKGLEERFTDNEFINAVLESMVQRRDNIEQRLRDGELEVRVLFLQSELEKAFQVTGENLQKTIKRYRYLLNLIALPNFEVRLIPKLSKDALRDIYSASYALIYNPTPDNDYDEADITLAYASQATTNFFEIHIIQINTAEVKDRVYQFERFWASSLNEKQTVQYIQDLISQSR
ncbi:MAG: SIR2 family protein [bacterium]|nr:SIR2 family protein [bacterium]